jgi:hypothetical protein
LNYPSVLSHWHEYTDFCYGAPEYTSASVVCYEDSVTQLHIIGEKNYVVFWFDFSEEKKGRRKGKEKQR